MHRELAAAISPNAWIRAFAERLERDARGRLEGAQVAAKNELDGVDEDPFGDLPGGPARIVETPELEAGGEPALKHDGSTNALIRRYRSGKRR